MIVSGRNALLGEVEVPEAARRRFHLKERTRTLLLTFWRWSRLSLELRDEFLQTLE